MISRPEMELPEESDAMSSVCWSDSDNGCRVAAETVLTESREYRRMCKALQLMSLTKDELRDECLYRCVRTVASDTKCSLTDKLISLDMDYDFEIGVIYMMSRAQGIDVPHHLRIDASARKRWLMSYCVD